MDLNQINQTTHCFCDLDQDGEPLGYVIFSSLCANVKGFGNTAQKALKMQQKNLKQAYKDYRKGKFVPEIEPLDY
ncbi:MAG: hypothetical protein ACKO34_02225 [Vampirovibrionales bacterium]